jgi:hypothetical protein
MATPTKHRSAMSERLCKLAAEIHQPEPYPVTKTIVVTPPTRVRSKAMSAAELQIYLCNNLLSQAVTRTQTAPPALADDATDEQKTEHEQALAAWKKQTQDVDDTIKAINDKAAAAQDDYEHAFFGDAYQAVMDYFEDKPQLWEAFAKDIKAEFLPPTPDDGVCPTCGHIDQDTAGKESSSSTSSTTTGMRSKETSPPSSQELTLVNGLEANAVGASS